MNYTDVFVYLLYTGIYLGQAVKLGVYYGCFEQSLTFTRSQANMLAVMESLKAALNDAVGYPDGNLRERLLALAGADSFTLTSLDVYGKYDGGETQKLSYEYNQPGTRTAGLTEPLPPYVTGVISASSVVYRQKGASKGLWGVNESDTNRGILINSQPFFVAANNLCYYLNLAVTASGVVDDYSFESCTVKRIKYVTEQGKVRSRLPFETADVPSCYRLGTWAVSSFNSTNGHRKYRKGGA